MPAAARTVLLLCGMLAAGHAIVTACLRERPGGRIARLGLYFGTGAGAMALAQYLLCFFFDALTFAAAEGLSLACMVYYLYSRKKQPVPQTAPSPSGLQSALRVFCAVIIAAVLVIVGLRALLLPMHLADDRGQWAIKAKIFYAAETVFPAELQMPHRVLYHAAYPPLVPVLEAQLFTALGGMDDRGVKVIFPLFFAALLGVFKNAVQRQAGGTAALVLTAVLATLPVFLHDVHGNPGSGYADVPLTFFYVAAACLLCRWMREYRTGQLVLAGLLIACAAFTKKEGLVLWGLCLCAGACRLLAVPGSRRHTGLFLLLFGIGPLVLLAPWLLVNAGVFVPPWEGDFSLSAISVERLRAAAARMPELLGTVAALMFGAPQYMLLAVLLALVLLRPARAWHPESLFYLALLGGNVCALLAAVCLYPHSWWRNFLFDIPRLLIPAFPVALLWIGSRLCRDPGAG